VGRFLAVVTTVGTRAEARLLARALVERHLAACTQISEIESFYLWEGALHDDPEFRVLVKTTDAAYDAVERTILELHPYELPAIHAFPIEHMHAPYAEWVETRVDGEPER
jgi:periplasmic divalent cation tolerance protein